MSGVLSRRISWTGFMRRTPPVVWALVLMAVFFSSREPSFLTVANLANLLCQGSILIILCLGVAFVRIAGGIDLSVGAVMTFSGMGMAWVLTRTSLPVAAGVTAALAIGGAFGMLNGIFVSKLQIPSFIATLGTQGIAIGFSLGMNKGYVISELPSALEPLGNGIFLGLPVPIWFFLLAALLSIVLLDFTPFGVYTYAIGGNEEALVLSGKPSWLYKAFCFGCAGLMAGLAAVVITSRTMVAQPTVGVGMEFEAFFASVLGGVSAGRGGVAETMLGVLFILILRNGLNLIGVPTYFQLAIIGVMLISGIILSMLLDKRLNR